MSYFSGVVLGGIFTTHYCDAMAEEADIDKAETDGEEYAGDYE